MEGIINSENISVIGSSSDSFLISETESVLRDIQNEDEPTLSGTSTIKKRKSAYSILSLYAYYDTKEAIDKTKEARANKSLIKWIVCSGISFSAFDSPYFEDFTKILNPGYNSPKRTALTTSVLEVEAANIMLKVEKELSKSKNLTSICRLPHARKVLSNCQTIISFFRNSYTAGAALREEIICSFTVLEQEPQIFDRVNSAKNLINDRQFWIDVEQLRNILGPVKRAVKNVEFRTTLLADVFVELVKMAIAIQETSVLYNNQFRRDCIAIYNKRDFLEPTIYKNHVLKKALEIWKQLGGGRTSADLLKTQMNLYRNQEHPFDDKFIATADTITNWWMSIDLKRNEDHDGTSEKDEQEDGTDLFSEEDSFSFLEELNNELMEEDTENTSDEQIDLVGENSVTLEVESFITLSSKLEYSESSNAVEEIVHGDKNFDVNDLL
ncbi:1787_t:CDS:2 [Racocetra fulgida]|uniref:1787_t:CDS:1 n=1 Tax=Racocetra fulgida TaxID=60492 RepID=A0A9N8ZH54_9GLOM|nr:1787_t:CDS:2 [Racocetra fulgida]